VAFDELDLSDRLLITRRGTAYFAQRLAELSDDDLDGDTLLAGWSRRHLLAHVGYNAAALCRLLDWAATGVETPMYASPEQRRHEIDEGATLSAAALRNLFDHTVARLDEKWRHLPASAWSTQVRTAQGRLVPASETAWMRTREVWIHAVDLDNGGRFGDFPDIVLDSLLADIVGMWRKKDLGGGLVLAVDGCAPLRCSGILRRWTRCRARSLRWCGGPPAAARSG
jgi:maleylpyruvate isomerase